MELTFLKLFGFSRGTFFSWQKQKRPALMLIMKYFSEEELLEYMNTGKISRLEELASNDFEVLMEKHIAYDLQYKFRNDIEGSFTIWFGDKSGKKYFKEIIKDIQKNDYTKANSKEKILGQLKGLEKTTELSELLSQLKIDSLSNYVERHLSELECFVLIKYYNIVMDHEKYIVK